MAYHFLENRNQNKYSIKTPFCYPTKYIHEHNALIYSDNVTVSYGALTVPYYWKLESNKINVLF